MRRASCSASTSTPVPATSRSSAHAPPGPGGRKAVRASSARERRVERPLRPGERAREKEVSELHQRRARAPRLCQHEPVRAALEEPSGEGLRSGHVGPAKLVDGLLPVADDRDGALSAQALEQLDLRAARVLEFVHQERAHALALRSAGRGVPEQQVAAEAGEVVEVQRAGPRLQFAVAGRGMPGEQDQIRGERRAPHSGVGVEQRVPGGPGLGDDLLVRTPCREVTGRREAQDRPRLRKLSRRAFQYRTAERRRSRLAGLRKRGAEIGERLAESRPGALVFCRRGCRVLHELLQRGGALADLAQQPRELVGEAADESPLRAQPHLGAKPPRGGSGCGPERALQRAQRRGFAGLTQEACALRLVEELEAGIDPGGRGVAPQDLGAERMDGADLRQPEVAADAPERGILRCQLVHPGADAPLQLARGLLGEGHRPEPGGRNRRRAAQELDAERDEVVRLAGARARLHHGATAGEAELSHAAPLRVAAAPGRRRSQPPRDRSGARPGGRAVSGRNSRSSAAALRSGPGA